MAFIRSIGNSNEIDRILNKHFTSIVRTGYVEVGKDDICLPVYYKDFAHKINKFEVKDDDVYVLGHPKTGTSWTQEMVWLIMNNLDYETARKTSVYSRSKLLEFSCLYDINALFKNAGDATGNEMFEKVINQSSPRIIKCHLPWSLLPEELHKGIKTPKIIATLRNPEDVCVSFYHYAQTNGGYSGTFEDYCKLFLAGRIPYGPFWKNTLSLWNERHRSNILLLYFNDMVEDLQGTIKKVSKFLEKPLTDEEVTILSNHLKFESMKDNPAVYHLGSTQRLKDIGVCVIENKFMRSGKVGEYKLKLSPDQIQSFQSWREKNAGDSGLVL